MKKDIKNEDLIHQINREHPEYLIKDLNKLFKIIEEDTLINLAQGNSIKFGKLLKLESVELPPRKHYDGINHKQINLGKRRVIKVRQLNKLKQINKATH